MKLVLSKDVVGLNKDTGEQRLFAKAGDVISVILINPKFYWCINEKGNYRDLYFPVQLSQVERIIEENDKHSNDEDSLSEYEVDDIERTIERIFEATERDSTLP